MTNQPMLLPAKIVPTAIGAPTIDASKIRDVQLIQGAAIVEVQPNVTEQITWDQIHAVRWQPENQVPQVLVHDLDLDLAGFWAAKVVVASSMPSINSGQVYEVQVKDGWLYVKSADGLISFPVDRLPPQGLTPPQKPGT